MVDPKDKFEEGELPFSSAVDLRQSWKIGRTAHHAEADFWDLLKLLHTRSNVNVGMEADVSQNARSRKLVLHPSTITMSVSSELQVVRNNIQVKTVLKNVCIIPSPLPSQLLTYQIQSSISHTAPPPALPQNSGTLSSKSARRAA